MGGRELAHSSAKFDGYRRQAHRPKNLSVTLQPSLDGSRQLGNDPRIRET